MVCSTEQKYPQKSSSPWRERSALKTSMSLLIYRALKIYSTQLDVWLTVAGYSEGTSIPKAKSVNQSFHNSAECAFLYAGLT